MFNELSESVHVKINRRKQTQIKCIVDNWWVCDCSLKSTTHIVMFEVKLKIHTNVKQHQNTSNEIIRRIKSAERVFVLIKIPSVLNTTHWDLICSEYFNGVGVKTVKKIQLNNFFFLIHLKQQPLHISTL